MGVEMLYMLVQNVFGAGIEDAKGYLVKRLLLASVENGYRERVLNEKEKQIVLEAILEFAEVVGVEEEFMNLIFKDE